MEKTGKDIRDCNLEEIDAFIKSISEKSFRSKQIYEWLWQKGAQSFDEMSNLSKSLRNELKNRFTFPSLQIDFIKKSEDKSLKVLFKTADEKFVEGVLIPSLSRVTACISTQIGCALACSFCATGKLGFDRNLSAGEIFDQVILLKKLAIEHYANPLSNIVLMGMGEPLLNYENVFNTVKHITSANELNFSYQRLTLSTVGIPKMIQRMADDDKNIQLAVSLHAATDVKRNKIIPFNKQSSLAGLTEALKYYHQKTKRRISLEYIIIGGFNDTLNDAKSLAEFCKNFPVKINIIEYNAVEGSPYQKATADSLSKFTNFLLDRNLIVKTRKSRGADIDAACGQLAGKAMPKNTD